MTSRLDMSPGTYHPGVNVVRGFLGGLAGCLLCAGVFAFFAPFVTAMLGEEPSTAFYLPGGWRIPSSMVSGAGVGFAYGLVVIIREGFTNLKGKGKQ